MFTTNYASLARIKPPAVAVSISRGKPRTKGGWKAKLAPGVQARDYDALAPSWAALKASPEEYDRQFNLLLRRLDPHKVFADLTENAVLLCHCKPNEFCHRRIVAEWLEEHLGIVVPELGLDRDETYVNMTEAYDFFVAPEKKLEWIEKQIALGNVP